MKILDVSDENVNITEGIPRHREDGSRWKWIFVNVEMDSPISEEEAKEMDFAIDYRHNRYDLQFRLKDKQFLYFKAVCEL